MMNSRHRMPLPVNRAMLDCFDIALTDEEIDFLLRVGTEDFARKEVAARSGMPEEPARRLFARLTEKGFFWPQPGSNRTERFSLSGIMVGWFEIFLADGSETPEKEEFARRFDLYFRSLGKMNFFPVRNLINRSIQKALPPAQSIIPDRAPDESAGRTIAVQRTIDARPMRIYPAHNVLQLIEKHGGADNIALVHCFCRQYHRLIHEPCRFGMPSESCIAIGSLARHSVESGKCGRYISKEDAIALVQEMERKGAVHQVFHEGEDVEGTEIAVCNCCWDCCGVFGSYNRAILPLRFRSYYEAQLPDPALCSGCEICVEHCPVQAISMNGGIPAINRDMCIGCGQCRIQCAEDAIQLIPGERDVVLPLRKRSEARIFR